MTLNKSKKRKILKLEKFLPYRLSVLSNNVSANIAKTYQDKFALSITEWRIMAILAEYPEISADAVCNKTQMEKSIVSRAVSKLLDRKLIFREFDPEDRRRSMLTLSDTGLSVYDEIVPISSEYEKQLIACFSIDEYHNFMKLLDKLDKKILS